MSIFKKLAAGFVKTCLVVLTCALLFGALPLTDAFAGGEDITLDPTYQTMLDGMNTLQKVAGLNDTQLKFIVEKMDLMEDYGFKDMSKVSVALSTYFGGSEVKDFRNAVDTKDYIYLVGFLNNIKASISNDTKSKLGIDKNELLFIGLSVLGSNLDLTNVTDQLKTSVYQILTPTYYSSETDARSHFSLIGFTFGHWQSFLSGLNPPDHDTLVEIIRFLRYGKVSSHGGSGSSPTGVVDNIFIGKTQNQSTDGSSIVVQLPANTTSATITSSALNTLTQENKDLVIKSSEVTITVPSGSIDTSNTDGNVVIKAEPVSETVVNEIQSNPGQYIKAFGKVYELSALLVQGDKSQKINFNKPVLVALSYEGQDLTGVDLDKLGAYWFNETTKAWEFVGGKLNRENKTIEFYASHFSKYTIMQYSKTFSDTTNHWAKSDIDFLASKHIILGMTDKLFMPNKDVTRAQFASLLVKALGLNIEAGKQSTFKDVNKNQWYNDAVVTLYNAGIIKGVTAASFAPEAKITREEMAIMIINALKYAKVTTSLTNAQVKEKLAKFKDAKEISVSAKTAVAQAVSLKIIAGRTSTSFASKAYATRAEGAKMIRVMFTKLK